MNRVVQKASAQVSNRGRPPLFDNDSVIDSAVEVFWRRGYDAASLTELEQCLGINRSTLYNSFDGKAGLFDDAVRAYRETVEAQLLGPLRDGTDGIADVVAFVERQRESLAEPDVPTGCLLVNAMVSGDAPEATTLYVEDLRTAIAAALRRAEDLGEAEPEQRAVHTAAFVTSVLGIAVASKSGMNTAGLSQLLDGFRATVESWTQPRR